MNVSEVARGFGAVWPAGTATISCQVPHTGSRRFYGRAMSAGGPLPHPRRLMIVAVAGAGLVCASAAGIGVIVVLAVAVIAASTPGPCEGAAAGGAAQPGAIALGPAGSGAVVGASEYGGSGDPTSGTVGSSGAGLLAHPDSYAELGGTSFQTATAMGGLAYMTPLRITWQGHSAIAYKRDIGLGGAPVDGLPRVIDLWWELAGALRIPYENGLWSGAVRVARPPDTGSAPVLGQSAAAPSPATGGAAPAPGSGDASGPGPASGCGAPVGQIGVPTVAGPTARRLTDGRAAAPAGAPGAVRGIIAAGNQISGRPYLFGAGHGLPLDQLAPAYDCSSSVEHLLYGGGLLPAGYGAASAALESWGRPGPGRWVTIYANPDHVFMYVAGLRWDTWNAAGPGDGSAGIGWHPLVRDAAGFVARHPAGL